MQHQNWLEMKASKELGFNRSTGIGNGLINDPIWM